MTWQNAIKKIDSEADRPVYKLHSGGVFAVPTTPNPTAVPQPVAIVNRLLSAVAELDTVQRAVAADDTLTDIGKERKVAPLRDAVRKALAEAKSGVENLAGEVAQMRQATFNPPPLGKDDFVAALQDRELRDWVRGLSGPERGQAIEDIATQPRLMEAILRSPVPMPRFSDVASQVYAEQMAQTNPEAKRVNIHQETTDWAALVVDQVGGALAGIIGDQGGARLAQVPPQAA